MLKVKVKTEKFKLSIPLPYVLLSVGISIISSNRLRKFINEQIAKNAEEKSKAYTIPELDKRELKSIVSELRKHKGTDLVEVKAKDGTEVTVRL